MTILQDLRFAGRLLLKDRWFTFVAVLALALGIGVNTTVFTFVNAVLIRGLPFDRPHEIVYVATRDTTADADNSSSASWHEFEHWRTRSRAFAGIAGFIGGQLNISDPEHPAERVSGASVSTETFGLLRQQPFLGRDFQAGEDQPGAAPVVILGYRVWKNRYGSDAQVLGRSLKINEVSYTIIGVMPEGMRFPVNADLWRPLLKPANQGVLHQRNVGVFARLAPGISWNQAAAEMAALSRELQASYPEQNKNIEARLMTFNQRFNGGPIRLMFLLLLGAVGFVLLIACANVANLLLARSAFRTREMALRTALGASRARVVRQLLIESILLAALGGLSGLSLAFVGIRLFDRAVANVGKPYWIVFDFDLSVAAYFAIVCVATGLIFGLAPALQTTRTNLNELMKEGGRGTAGGARARYLTSCLIIGELALTLALLTGAGLMARSFLKLYALDIGVETDHVLTMRTQLINSKYPTPESRHVFFDTMLDRLRAIPGVTNAALMSSVPASGGGQFLFEVEGRPVEQTTPRPRVLVVDASASYFDTLAVPVQRGRVFTTAEGAPGSEVVVVNQKLATQLFGNEDPLGRRIRLLTGDKEDTPGPWMGIVGVSPTIRQGDLRALEPASVLYRPYQMSSPSNIAIAVRTTVDPATLSNAVREAAKGIDAEQPLYAVQPLNDVLAEARWPYRVFGTMFVIFAAIALVLSAVGIYAITAYSVTQRTPEIGVRLALGAQASQISWLILRAALIQLAIGVGLGLLGAYGVSMALQSLVAQIPSADPITFTAITVLLALVTVAACLVPALRATRLDPLAALRID